MKKIIPSILIIIFLLAPASTVKAQPPPGQVPDQRPLGCKDKCALVSDEGQTITLWDKDGSKVYTYAAISHWTPTWGGGRYIYKRTDGFYALIGYESGISGIVKVYKHFKIEEHDLSIAAWDDTPTSDQDYIVIKYDTFPPTGIDGKTRYSFHVGIAGSVKLESSTGTPLANATVMLYLDDPKGPPIMEVKTKADGTFGTWDIEMWLNQKNANKIFLYARTEVSGKKLDNCGDAGQGIPAIKFPDDFRPHGNDPEKAKVIENVQLTLKETPEFCRTDRKQLTVLQEATGGDKDWGDKAWKWVVCKLQQFFFVLFHWLAHAGGWFLRRNY